MREPYSAQIYEPIRVGIGDYFKMIGICNSLPKCGSTWFSRCLRDVYIEMGYGDTPEILSKYGLEGEINQNCNADPLTAEKFSQLLIPCLHGEQFTIKSHEPPSLPLLKLMDHKIVSMVYLIRDPRDIVVSVCEFGQRRREIGDSHSPYCTINTIKDSIEFVSPYFDYYKRWLDTNACMIIRYEELNANPEYWLEKIIRYFQENQFSDKTGIIKKVVERYDSKKLKISQDSTLKDSIKFNKGGYRKLFISRT